MEYKLVLVETRDQIALCFEAFKELRPHIEKEQFIEQVVRQQDQAYQIIGLSVGGKIVSAAGFRVAEILAWGKVLYLDDLTTLPKVRGNGYAAVLMDWLIDKAKSDGCDQLHLDTGHHRHSAHKLYLKKGLNIVSHHLALELT